MTSGYHPNPSIGEQEAGRSYKSLPPPAKIRCRDVTPDTAMELFLQLLSCGAPYLANGTQRTGRLIKVSEIRLEHLPGYCGDSMPVSEFAVSLRRIMRRVLEVLSQTKNLDVPEQTTRRLVNTGPSTTPSRSSSRSTFLEDIDIEDTIQLAAEKVEGSEVERLLPSREVIEDLFVVGEVLRHPLFRKMRSWVTNASDGSIASWNSFKGFLRHFIQTQIHTKQTENRNYVELDLEEVMTCYSGCSGNTGFVTCISAQTLQTQSSLGIMEPSRQRQQLILDLIRWIPPLFREAVQRSWLHFWLLHNCGFQPLKGANETTTTTAPTTTVVAQGTNETTTTTNDIVESPYAGWTKKLPVELHGLVYLLQVDETSLMGLLRFVKWCIEDLGKDELDKAEVARDFLAKRARKDPDELGIRNKAAASAVLQVLLDIFPALHSDLLGIRSDAQIWTHSGAPLLSMLGVSPSGFGGYGNTSFTDDAGQYGGGDDPSGSTATSSGTEIEVVEEQQQWEQSAQTAEEQHQLGQIEERIFAHPASHEGLGCSKGALRRLVEAEDWTAVEDFLNRVYLHRPANGRVEKKCGEKDRRDDVHKEQCEAEGADVHVEQDNIERHVEQEEDVVRGSKIATSRSCGSSTTGLFESQQDLSLASAFVRWRGIDGWSALDCVEEKAQAVLHQEIENNRNLETSVTEEKHDAGIRNGDSPLSCSSEETQDGLFSSIVLKTYGDFLACTWSGGPTMKHASTLLHEAVESADAPAVRKLIDCFFPEPENMEACNTSTSTAAGGERRPGEQVLDGDTLPPPEGNNSWSARKRGLLALRKDAAKLAHKRRREAQGETEKLEAQCCVSQYGEYATEIPEYYERVRPRRDALAAICVLLREPQHQEDSLALLSKNTQDAVNVGDRNNYSDRGFFAINLRSLGVGGTTGGGGGTTGDQHCADEVSDFDSAVGSCWSRRASMLSTEADASSDDDDHSTATDIEVA
ncbi:unnamed protein product [Amoebophrya sp. A25]|nr:unnamed protein product [Amoebophrya sp. A25]|eukprot:GSA25T00027198001.1